LELPFFFVSVPEISLNALMLILWNKLAEMEEKELLEYWGEEYKEFMKTRGRFILLYSFGYFVHYALHALFTDSYTKAFFLRLMVVVLVGFAFNKGEGH